MWLTGETGNRRKRALMAALLFAFILRGGILAGAESATETDPTGTAETVETMEAEIPDQNAEEGQAEAEPTSPDAYWRVSEPFQTETVKSFQVPVPEGWSVQWTRARDKMRAVDEDQQYMIQATVNELGGVFFAQETWGEMYSGLLGQLGVEMYLPVTVGDSELGMLFPQGLEIDGEVTTDHRLRLAYGHGTKLLLLDILSMAESLQPDTVTELLPGIAYLAAEGEATYADYQLTVQPPEGKTEFSAGEKAKFTAAFANADTVNARKKNAGVSWYIMTRDESASGLFSVSKNGTVTISKDLQEPTEFAVVAVSDTAGTQSYLELTALPQIQEMALDRTELTLYMGQTETAELQLTVAPETATRQVEWLTSAKGVVTVEPGEDGMATLQALKPGQATITARDNVSGKRAKVTVTVILPVSEVTITGPEELKQAQKGFYHAQLTPKDATNRQIRWSVDVDESVAVMGKDGSLQVKKNAAPGTVITVYCEALGGIDGLKGEFRVTVTE